MSGSKNCYSLKLMIGKTDFTVRLLSVVITVTKDSVFQKIILTLSVNRTVYERDIAPYKNQVKLDIVTSKGLGSSEDVPDIDASFSYDLCITSEDGGGNTSSITEGVPQADTLTFTCVQRDQYLSMQKICKDSSFFKMTKQEILDKIMEGCPYVLQSEIEKPNKEISQLFIKPQRRYQALQYLFSKTDMFKGPKPDYINYCIDGKVYMGSCINNNLKPLAVIIGTEMSGTGDVTDAISKSTKKYNYSAVSDIAPTVDYSNTCLKLGANQKYCFFPMNKVFSKVDRKLKDYDSNMILTNTLGNDENTAKHIRKTNEKESWVYANGLDFIDDDEDNLYEEEQHIFEAINQAVTLTLNLKGVIKFEDFLMVGRRFQVTCGSTATKYDGDYFLDSSMLTFIASGNVWTGEVSVVLKSSVNLTNV